MKKIICSSLVLGLLSSTILTGCGGGGGSSITGVTSSSVDFTVVDGYIKNAVVKDSLGLIATEIGNGVYRFSSSPTYPITTSGGILIDNNVSFDINMTTYSGNIVSPVTSLIANSDSTIVSVLSSITNLSSDISDYAVDYLDTNNSTLAKLSQIAYTILKDDLKDDLKTEINTNGMPTNIATMVTSVKNSITNNSSLSTVSKAIKKAYIDTIASMDNNVSNYENVLSKYKQNYGKDGSDDDFDGDGINNYYEISLGLNPIDGSDINGSADNDGDGISNYKEIMYNTGYTVANTTTWESNTTSDGVMLSIKPNQASTFNLPRYSIADSNDSLILKTFDEATSFCSSLSYGGFSDWRLPTSSEAMQIFNQASTTSFVSINLYLNNILTSRLDSKSWSSTTQTSSSSWVYSSTGTISLQDNSLKSNTICIREY